MKRALLFVLVALTAEGGRFDRINSRCAQGRSDRGLACDDGAFFEFAPASGAGMGTACACTTPTGAKRETMTFTRTGDATCSRQGLATTGIANGDLVVCATNQPRIEPAGGILGVHQSSGITNPVVRFIDYANAAWADVGTPALTGGQASPWTGTYATSAVEFSDNDGAAFEGRTQTITVVAATQYTMSCWVKAGTLSSWTLSLDGTTASGTGLSSSTWSLVTVTDASSSGVAIAAQALNGSTAAGTGTVIWGGCQVETGARATAMQPTVAVAESRGFEVVGFARSVPTLTGVCTAATLQVSAVAAYQAGSGVYAPLLSSGTVANTPSGAYMWPYSGGAGTNFSIDGTGSSGAPSGWTPAVLNATLTGRYRSGHDGTAWSICINGSCSANGVPSAWAAPTYASIKFFATTSVVSDAIWTRVQVDPDPTRCTP